MHAKSTTGHSQRFSLMMAMRSPRWMPQLSIAALSARTRPYIVRPVIGSHPPALFHIATVSLSRPAKVARMSLTVLSSNILCLLQISDAADATLSDAPDYTAEKKRLHRQLTSAAW